ncbi:RNA-guided pseudouridylation complex pseudouridine synthase subunit Cbf5 [Methanobrevibacter boviskoreani]|uniref:RNA-guided pseudouridylation complex pseudouridine synthase subunit Cbf5 n=1 Tax=Methanobrevibacter boviskoreani TaxID=1348249 RepID=UPI0023F2FF30|nr:RNA-guided pseudouridylation complex pseudouridine synthase subunit Cbf5 [Methanobrevibacter boviskoreani]MDD6256438.1 RNA-guided pseudouridylation complex pseudouridine synthase subunit Cbf5 [Methanobrevibacter boviskoreani]
MSELLEKSRFETDFKYGCVPEERTIEEYLNKGVINLDKPSGPTSHEVDSWVLRILEADKTGHGGTLDPKVTGILPMGINSATRSMQLLSLASKEYVCLMNIHESLDEDIIRGVFDEFTGKIFQMPPVKSAVKREIRAREVYYANISEIEDRFVLFRIGCQAGTYVRTYCHDIGEALGCGAHMAELRRTQVGSFSEDNNLVTLQDITDAYYYYKHEGNEKYLRESIMPMEEAASHLPKIYIKDSTVAAITHGADLAAGGISILSDDIRPGDTVAIMTLKGELVGSGISRYSSQDILDAENGIIVNTNHVFMDENLYPISWK